MRYRLKLASGAVLVCNDPACVAEWMERGAELQNPLDLERLAREARQGDGDPPPE